MAASLLTKITSSATGVVAKIVEIIVGLIKTLQVRWAAFLISARGLPLWVKLIIVAVTIVTSTAFVLLPSGKPAKKGKGGKRAAAAAPAKSPAKAPAKSPAKSSKSPARGRSKSKGRK